MKVNNITMAVLSELGENLNGLDSDGDPMPAYEYLDYPGNRALQMEMPDRPDVWCISPLLSGCKFCTKCFIHLRSNPAFQFHYETYIRNNSACNVIDANEYAFAMIYQN